MSETHLQALRSGHRLEEFEIQRVLGSGGFGITYLARDISLDREVVIKENLPPFAFRDTASSRVHPKTTTGEDADLFAWSLESFSREARTLAKFDHPGIVRVLRVFEANGTAYFVMPFVKGKTLGDMLAAGGSMSPGNIVPFTVAILEALDVLHADQVFHRDIKPDNILLTESGRPVLIDFGAARQMLSQRSHTVVESPGYTPFEQLQSRGNVGPWSDLYALGATLHKAITGQSPPKANDRMPDDGYQPLSGRSDLVSRYGADFLSGIDRALSVRITDRWQSAGEWKAALRGEKLPAQSPPEKTPEVKDLPPGNDQETSRRRDDTLPPPPPARALPWGKIAAACLALTGLVIGGMLWKQGEGEREAARVAEAQAAAQEKAKLELEAVQLAEATKAELDAARLAKEESDRKAKDAEEARLAADQKAEADMEAAQRARDEAANLAAEKAAQDERLKAAEAARLAAMPKAGERMEVEVADGVKMAFRWCPPGTFLMGSPASEAERRTDETQHPVTLTKGFWLGETEVTQGQWKAVMGSNPSNFKGSDKLPVEEVSWDDAQEFLRKVKTPAGMELRLPTEAEWEYACRAGTTTVFGHGDRLNGKEANMDGNYPYPEGTAKGPYLEKTVEVGSFPANQWGLRDMHGNVWEWCAGWYGGYPTGAVTDPRGPATGSIRVIRGGSWDYNSRNCRSANRLKATTDDRYNNTGCRVAAVPSP
jgi:formylglycine-generating enzyme required for sulfatase activity/serine/threonine protein kinase